MLSCPISVEIFFLWPGLVTPMAVRSYHEQSGAVVSSGTGSVGQWIPAASGSGGCWPGGKDLPYLWGHAANGGDIIASIEEVGGVRLQLEFSQPVVNGFCVLGRGRGKEQPMMVAAGAGKIWLLQAR